MHLASEEKYQRLATEVEEEKRKHQEYVLKSEDFVNLLGNLIIYAYQRVIFNRASPAWNAKTDLRSRLATNRYTS